MTLYLASIEKTQPTKGHPHYWDWDCCIVMVWLFAESREDASRRAAAIVAQLALYEFSAEAEVEVFETWRPQFAEKEREAREFGLALFFAPVTAGGAIDLPSF